MGISFGSSFSIMESIRRYESYGQQSSVRKASVQDAYDDLISQGVQLGPTQCNVRKAKTVTFNSLSGMDLQEKFSSLFYFFK